MATKVKKGDVQAFVAHAKKLKGEPTMEKAQSVIQCGQILIARRAAGGSMDSPVVRILGDQSSGKTTIVLSLTQNLVFIIDPKTGTKAKTLIIKSFNPEFSESAARSSLECSIQYKGDEYIGLSQDDLTRKYQKIFKNAKVDPENVCSVRIQSSEPCLGLVVEDHPGLYAVGLESTLECQQATIDKFLKPGGAEHGALLMCQSVMRDTSEAAWLKLEGLQKVPKGQLIVAITRMDQFDHNQLAQLIKKNKNLREEVGIRRKHKGSAQSPESNVFKCNVLQILKIILFDVLEAAKLPRDTPGFFVAGFRGSQDDLKMKRDHKERLAFFSKDPKFGESAADNDMMEKLQSKDDWKKNGIELQQMKQEERDEFTKIVGMEKMSRELLKRQTRAYLDVCKAEDTKNDNDVKACVEKLDNLKGLRQKGLSFCDASFEFLKYHILMSHSLSTNQPLASFDDDSQVMSQAWTQMEPSLSWSLEEEWKEHRHHVRGFEEFPPENRQVENFQQVLEEIMEQSDGKALKLPAVIRRLVVDIAVRSSLTRSPVMDFADVARQADYHASLNEFSMSNVMGTKISEAMTQMNASSTQYIPTRAALSTLKYGLAVARIVQELPKYKVMCPSDDSFTLAGVDLRDLQEKAEKAFTPSTSHGKRTAPRAITLRECLRQATGDLASPNATCDDVNTCGKLNGKPTEDIQRIIFAMFFQRTEVQVRNMLSPSTDKFFRSLSPSLVMLLEFNHLFLYRDPKYIQDWMACHPSSDFACAFGKDQTDVQEQANIVQHLFGARQGSRMVRHRFEGREFTHIALSEELMEDSERSHSLFAEIAQDCKEAMQQMHAVENLSAKQKGTLFHSILTASQTPDVTEQRQSTSNLRSFERSNLEWVSKRYASVAAQWNTLQAMVSLNASTYEWVHPQAVQNHQEEANERLMSILLGYEYPFSKKERPPRQAYLEPEHVMAFVYRHKDHLLQFSQDATQEPQDNSPLDIIPLSDEDETMVKESTLMLSLLGRLFRSHDHGAKDHAKGREYLDLLLEAHFQRPSEFQAMLQELLAETRYKHEDPTGTVNMQISSKEEEMKVLQKYSQALKSFCKFVEQHGSEVSFMCREDVSQVEIRPAPQQFQLAREDEDKSSSSEELSGNSEQEDSDDSPIHTSPDAKQVPKPPQKPASVTGTPSTPEISKSQRRSAKQKFEVSSESEAAPSSDNQSEF